LNALAFAAFAASPISAQQFLRQPTAAATDLVRARFVKPEDLSTRSRDQLTRIFHVNPNAFICSAGETTGTGKSLENKSVQERVRDYFTAAGIDLAGGSAPRFFFNDRTGTLMVQGTPAQLEAVERALQALSVPPPRVAIEVRMVETMGEVQNPKLKPLLTKLEMDDLDLPSALPFQTVSRDNSIRTLRTLVLTEGEVADLIRSAEQAEGVDLLSAPRTVTISGRQARIAIEGQDEDVITDPPFHGSRKLRLNAE
jgi:type II secretory pathway component GspD/PulD (secretin)